MGNRMYDALEISKYIIDKCTAEKHPITNLQLQKILYFLQKKNLVTFGKCLFDNDIEAWQFGPVVPEVYYQYCGFGSSRIAMSYQVNIADEDIEMINPIIEDKRMKNPWDLVSETHAPGKAWDVIYRGGLGNKDVIPPDLIRTKG